ncbi:MAG: MerR family transcriptional regulator [Eubacteriales bacterium]|nr:MerR family transcriptional regulator [Eubacteriales bacterium]
MNYSIREVCKRFDLTAHTLRYYEKIGLLTGIERTSGGIRSYSDEDLEILGLICCLKNTGMPLSEIARFIKLTQEGNHTLKERCDMLVAHQTHVIERMEEMQKHLDKINCKIGYFSGMLKSYEETGA